MFVNRFCSVDPPPFPPPTLCPTLSVTICPFLISCALKFARPQLRSALTPLLFFLCISILCSLSLFLLFPPSHSMSGITGGAERPRTWPKFGFLNGEGRRANGGERKSRYGGQTDKDETSVPRLGRLGRENTSSRQSRLKRREVLSLNRALNSSLNMASWKLFVKNSRCDPIAISAWSTRYRARCVYPVLVSEW